MFLEILLYLYSELLTEELKPETKWLKIWEICYIVFHEIMMYREEEPSVSAVEIQEETEEDLFLLWIQMKPEEVEDFPLFLFS